MYIPKQGERSLSDLKRWSKLEGIYYETHPQDKNMIRTRHVFYHALSGRYQMHQPSNWHYATPTPEMRPYHDAISRAIFTMQPLQSRGFF